MSFFKKIVENKHIAAGALAIGALIAGSVYLYNSYQNEGKEEIAQDNIEQLNMQKQIAGLKSQVNVANPSLDDVKRILQFAMNIAKKKIFEYSRAFKKKGRQQYTNASRKEHMAQYMNMVSNGMQEVRNLATTTQTDILRQLGLTEASFMKYQAQLGMFMQELMMQQQKNTTTKELTLEQVKYAIRLQIQYLKTEGQAVLDQMLEATKNWPANKKSQLPLLLSVVIADGAFEDHPQIDEQAVQAAEMQMQHHLMSQMAELQQAMVPIMQKLSAQLGGMGGMGMGGMGGFEGFGGDEMGGDPFGGLTGQQMQQLQELERMRLQDPAAFEQMMRNMYG